MPLTKKFYADGTKDSYPHAAKFTSHRFELQPHSSGLKAFHTEIVKQAKLGRCLIKGALRRELRHSDRKGATGTNDKTAWVCLDFDSTALTPRQALNKLGLSELEHIVQYSASERLKKSEEGKPLHSFHIFALLSKPVLAPQLKAWLMRQNLLHFREEIILSRTGCALHWPLDITACQNDKLLYITPPEFEKPLKDPFHSVEERITYYAGTCSHLDITKELPDINEVKAEAQTLLNDLRKASGLKAKSITTTLRSGFEVVQTPDACLVTESKVQGEYVRLNVNGGDSWAYWHPVNNYELIHDYKTGLSYPTKKFVPDYYKSCVEQAGVNTSTPSADSDLVLAFRDLPSAAYYNGLWNPKLKKLTLHQAQGQVQLHDWLASHGLPKPQFIPIWTLAYDTQDIHTIVDEGRHTVNMFKPSSYMLLIPETALKPEDDFPTIYSIIRHMLGEEGKSYEVSKAFLNWFAVIFQRKGKPKPLTAWVVSGTQGTGKGFFFHKIATPLLGQDNVSIITTEVLREQFNTWMHRKLFVFVDEVDASDFKEKGLVTAKLQNQITEPMFQLRAMRENGRKVENTAAFFFSSNKKQPVVIPYDDRRYNVATRQMKKLFAGTRPDLAAVESELPAFARWLAAHKADVEQANTITQTQSRLDMQELSMNSIELTCRQITAGDFEALWSTLPDPALLKAVNSVSSKSELAFAYTLIIKKLAQAIMKEKSPWKVSREDLGIILDYNCGNIPQAPTKLGRLLALHNIELRSLRIGSQFVRGIEVYWNISPELRKVIAAELEIKHLRVVK